MLIRFTKAKNTSKHDTLTCVRSDGSKTWWTLPTHFAEHDMLHYIVETTLGFREAFFGLIAAGRDIDSFGTRDGKKDAYTREEGDAELIVGLLQVELSDSTLPSVLTVDGVSGTAAQDDISSTSGDFWTMLSLACTHRNYPLPQSLLEERSGREKMNKIRARMCDLSEQWCRLPDGGSLELSFPERARQN